MQSGRAALLASSATIVALAMVSACGSSATTSTGPSPLTRCSLTLNTGEQNFPPEGGSGSIGVTAARECTWTVSVEGTWLSVKSGQSGQGDGRVEFTAAANPDPVTRRGALVLNSQRAEISQSAAPCVISLAETSASFSPGGGNGHVDVRASSALCTWTASADQPWISLRSGSEGKGTASVLFEVAVTTGPPRVGTITVAGQRFSVMQSEGCTYSIAPLQANVGAQGGSGQLSINTAPQCPWTALSSAEWVSFAQPSGSGPATVSFSVQSTNGPSRVGTAVVAGQTFTINQAQGCSFQVQPTSYNVPAGGGTGMVNVAAAQGCGWNASSDAAWITIQGVASGTGNGAVMFAAAATTGPARTGTLTVAGQRVTVTQTQGCTYSISPAQETIPSAGGTGRVNVTAADGCAWTASSGVPWISITAGATGSGNGAVSYTVAATTGPSRSGTLQIAGQTFTVNQSAGCVFTLSPTSANVTDAAGTTSFEVRSNAGCAWTAGSQATWITIASPPNGNGTGTATVQLSIAANTGPSRTGTVTAGGQTFTVTQGGGCTFSLTPTSENVPASGGPAPAITVNAPAGCPWTAAANAEWLSMTSPSPAGGTGPGNVTYSVTANTGAQRTGTLTIAGQPFIVTQASGCTFTVAPDTVTSTAAGGAARIDVTSAADCQWTASSTIPWITMAQAGGSGSGPVDLSVAANTGPARTGTVSIAGRTVTVNQESGCTYSINPTSVTVPATGGAGNGFAVTAGAGCAWRAVSQVPWIVITSGEGVGDGVVQGSVEANTTGAARTGTVTIAGLTFTVNQQ